VEAGVVEAKAGEIGGGVEGARGGEEGTGCGATVGHAVCSLVAFNALVASDPVKADGMGMAGRPQKGAHC
jgi:hypothetical protein